MKVRSINISDEDYRQAEILGKKQGLTKADIIRKALREYIRKHKKQ